MQSGERNDLVTFERLVTEPDDMGGQSNATWWTIGQAWAAVKWIGGGDGERDGAIRSSARYRFTVPSVDADAAAVSPNDRIMWNGEPYAIREQPRRLRTSPETEIVAETGVM